MKRIATIALVLLGVTAGGPAAAEVDSYLDLYVAPWSKLSVGTDDSDGYGYGIKGAVSITDFLYGRGEYLTTRQDFDTTPPLNYDMFRLGFGTVFAVNWPFIESVNGDVEYVNGQFGPFSEDGYGVHIGATGNVLSWLAVYATVGYLDVGVFGDGPEYVAGASGNLSSRFGWFADYRMAQLEDNVEFEPSELRLGVRLVLGSTGQLLGPAEPAKPARRR